MISAMTGTVAKITTFKNIFFDTQSSVFSFICFLRNDRWVPHTPDTRRRREEILGANVAAFVKHWRMLMQVDTGQWHILNHCLPMKTVRYWRKLHNRQVSRPWLGIVWKDTFLVLDPRRLSGSFTSLNVNNCAHLACGWTARYSKCA